jgi:nicotinamidase-related amidase
MSIPMSSSASSRGPLPTQSPATPSPLRLDRAQALFLLVDVQERLATAMHEPLLDRLRKNAIALLRGAAVLGVPVLVSEQYKKGLGETLPELVAALPAGTPRLDKLAFSAFADANLASAILASGRSQIVVFGMEAHICVYQTVRDLSHTGFKVHVPHDALCSRDAENLRVGMVLCERAGATVTATETVLFDLLGAAGTTEFKAISALVK